MEISPLSLRGQTPISGYLTLRYLSREYDTSDIHPFVFYRVCYRSCLCSYPIRLSVPFASLKACLGFTVFSSFIVIA